MKRIPLKKLLFLGANRYFQKSIEALSAYGYKVLVIDRNPESPGFKSADKFAVIDITDENGAYQFALANSVDGIIAVNDFGVRTAAYVSNKMGLPGLSYETAIMATDKALMRKKWSEDGVPVPRFFVTHSVEEANAKLKDLEFPIIVKPANSCGGGSRGVKVALTREEFENAFNFAQSFYTDKRVVVEECIMGTEHSIETAVVNGEIHILAVSQKEKTPYPYRVDRKVIYPAVLSKENSVKLKETVEKAIKSIGIDAGVVHVELAFTENGPILFEVGARCGGGATPQIVEEYTGIQQLRVATKLAIGEPIDSSELTPRYSKGAVYHFFIFPESTSKIKEVKGRADMQKIKEIIDMEIFVKPGDVIGQVRTTSDRQGFAVIVAEDLNKALEISKTLDMKVAIVY